MTSPMPTSSSQPGFNRGIAECPVELLLRIWKYEAAAQHQEYCGNPCANEPYDCREDGGVTTAVLSVCKHWREVALCAPELFSRIKVKVHSRYFEDTLVDRLLVWNMPEVRLRMKHSQSHPLQLSIGCVTKNEPALSTCRPFSLRQFNVLDRIKTLCADVDNGRLMINLSLGQMPKIEHAQLIEGVEDHKFRLQAAWLSTARFWASPNLKELIIRKAFETPLLLGRGWERVRLLDLGDESVVNQSQLDYLFHLASDLQSLRVAVGIENPRYFIPDGSYIIYGPLPAFIEARELKVLELSYKPADVSPMFLADVYFPRLQRLFLHLRGLAEKSMVEWLEDPQRMPNLTHLELTASVIPVSITAGMLKALQRLRVLRVRPTSPWDINAWEEASSIAMGNQLVDALEGSSKLLEVVELFVDVYISPKLLMQFLLSRRNQALRRFGMSAWFGCHSWDLQDLKNSVTPIVLRVGGCTRCDYVAMNGKRHGFNMYQPQVFSCGACLSEHVLVTVDADMCDGGPAGSRGRSFFNTSSGWGWA